MGRKHVKANKKKWLSYTPEKKSEIGSKIAKSRWNNASIIQRKAQGKMLLEARKKSKNFTFDA